MEMKHGDYIEQGISGSVFKCEVDAHRSVIGHMGFGMVVMFYMHLKPDSKIYTAIFTAPLVLAAVVILALMTLLGAWVY